MHATKGTRFTNREGFRRSLNASWIESPRDRPQKKRRRSGRDRPRRRMIYLTIEPSMAEVRDSLDWVSKEGPEKRADPIAFQLPVRSREKDRIQQEAKKGFLSNARRIITKRDYQSLSALFAEDKAAGRTLRKILERMVKEAVEEELRFLDNEKGGSLKAALILIEQIYKIRKILGSGADFYTSLDADDEISMMEEMGEDPLACHFVQAEVDDNWTKYKIELIIARMTGKIRSLESFRLPEVGEILETGVGSAGRLRIRGMALTKNSECPKETVFEGTYAEMGERLFHILNGFGLFPDIVRIPTEDEDTVFDLPRGRKLIISNVGWQKAEYEIAIQAPNKCYHLDFQLR
ncbi:MAG: hypothetical protein ABII71_02435 [Candidatus Micrarchaeota archaeon]